jgi:type IV pilus assembly protein PilF
VSWTSRSTILLLVLLTAACAGSANQSRSSLERSSGLNSTSPVRAAEINTRLGIGYLELGQLEVALEKLQIAVLEDPGHVPAHFALALLFERLGDDRNAERHYRAADRLAPDDGGVQNAYGVYLCRQREFQTADRHFQRAMQDPFYGTPEVALTNAGSCARRAGREQVAIDYLREALNIDADNLDALYNLAEIYYQQGDAFRARAFLQRLESQGVAEAATFLLGFQIESDLGNEEQAERYAVRLERDFPTSPETEQVRRLIRNDS